MDRHRSFLRNWDSDRCDHDVCIRWLFLRGGDRNCFWQCGRLIGPCRWRHRRCLGCRSGHHKSICGSHLRGRRRVRLNSLWCGHEHNWVSVNSFSDRRAWLWRLIFTGFRNGDDFASEDAFLLVILLFFLVTLTQQLSLYFRIVLIQGLFACAES